MCSEKQTPRPLAVINAWYHQGVYTFNPFGLLYQKGSTHEEEYILNTEIIHLKAMLTVLKVKWLTFDLLLTSLFKNFNQRW